MAYVRKNEEIKVIKNPLLSQNILSEEISGISFIVPAAAEKPEDYGSNQNYVSPQIGAKTEGTDAKPPETQLFTDIPLDVSDTSEESKPQSPPSPPIKNEGSSFGLRSIIPSFVPLFAPQSSKNDSSHGPEVKLLTSEKQTSKRAISTETVVPELYSPGPREPTIQQNVSNSLASPVHLTESPVTSTTPLKPPPQTANFNKVGNANPYALKRTNNSTTKAFVSEASYFLPSSISPLKTFPSTTTPVNPSEVSLSSELYAKPFNPRELAGSSVVPDSISPLKTFPSTTTPVNPSEVSLSSELYAKPFNPRELAGSSVVPDFISPLKTFPSTTTPVNPSEVSLSSELYAKPFNPRELAGSSVVPDSISPLTTFPSTTTPVNPSEVSLSSELYAKPFNPRELAGSSVVPDSIPVTSPSIYPETPLAPLSSLFSNPNSKYFSSQLAKQSDTPPSTSSIQNNDNKNEQSVLSVAPQSVSCLPSVPPASVSSIHPSSILQPAQPHTTSSVLDSITPASVPSLTPSSILQSAQSPITSSVISSVASASVSTINPSFILQPAEPPTPASVLPSIASASVPSINPSFVLPPCPPKSVLPPAQPPTPPSGWPSTIFASVPSINPNSVLPPAEPPTTSSVWPSIASASVPSIYPSSVLPTAQPPTSSVVTSKAPPLISSFSSSSKTNPYTLNKQLKLSSPGEINIQNENPYFIPSVNFSPPLTPASLTSSLTTAPSSFATSSSTFHPSNVSVPPPVSDSNRLSNTNPYTLRFTLTPTANQGVFTPPTRYGSVPFFSQSTTPSNSSSPFNILSGPAVDVTSDSQNVQETSISDSFQSTVSNKIDSNTGSVVERIQGGPLMQSFTSAVSNFISSHKSPSDSNVSISSQKEPERESQQFIPSAVLDSNDSVVNNQSPQYHLYSTQSQSPFVHNHGDFHENKEIPSFPQVSIFNPSNIVNNNIIEHNTLPNRHGITDNTVCVSSITTVLSSAVPISGTSVLNPLTKTDSNDQVQQTFNSNLFNNNIPDNDAQNAGFFCNNLNNLKNSSTNAIKPLENTDLNLRNPQEAVKRELVQSEPGNRDSLKMASGDLPVIQPIPTFSYFSAPQRSCLPPALDQTSFQTKQLPDLPTSSFFKPIDSPNFHTTSVPSQNPSDLNVGSTASTPQHITNPTLYSKISFPPPNTTCPPKVTAVEKVPPKIEPPPKSEAVRSGQLDLEELEQIPLEGSAVPLYKPDYLSKKTQEEVPANTEVGNSYRLSRPLKKPTYAPVPDLGLTGKKSYPDPSSPSNISVSSQEEMAAIEAQSQNNRTSPPIKTSPSNSTTLETYYTNLLHVPNYRPPYHHWFFKSGQHKKSPWTPFSMADSLNLEQIYTSSGLSEDTKVATDGGRYDVEILRRKKTSVYWEEQPGQVRRCSWFVKSISDSRFTPYDENIAVLLEDEYRAGCESGEWNRRIELADGEVIILHSPSAMAHHVRSSSPDAWSAQPTLQQKPRVVKRGVEDFNISKGEPKQVDHLLLMVHGVGKACDLRFRSLVEVVDDFRSIGQQLVGSHFQNGVENGNVGRVEILPVEWHGALHTESINDRLSSITLPSIPRAREFTNETLLDILFYTSPVFAEKIVQAVGEVLNQVYTLYKARNPGFRGQISLGGHSLGSLILFDILCHQKVARPHLSTQASLQNDEDETVDELGFLRQTKAKLNRRMSYLTIGPGTGQPYTTYPQLLFQPRSFFALGSPIGMFVTVRGLESLGEDFKFPTCPAFFNIFHPNDPVAYRIEPLIKPELSTVPAVLIPHHKGRKRMHLELKETMAHVTAALKQKLVDSMKNTWNAVYHLTMFNRRDNSLQGDVDKAIEDEVLRDSYMDSDPPLSMVGEEGAGSDVRVGNLNGGRRVDYVLQEAPLETFNQYISAIRSHLVYWESEDTTLMILKEIYGGMGISPDTQVPQPILPFDLSSEPDTYSEYTYAIGATPTQFVSK